MTAIDKTKIRNTIFDLHSDGLTRAAHQIWDLLDAHRELDVELTHTCMHSPAVEEISNIIRANGQHSEIAGQTVLGCLSHYFDNDTNRLTRCQLPNGHHDMHTHRRTTDDGAVHLYLWEDTDAFNVLKTPSEPTT